MYKVDTWYGHWLGGVSVLHHGVKFKLSQSVVTGHVFLMTQIYGLLQLIIICTFA